MPRYFALSARPSQVLAPTRAAPALASFLLSSTGPSFGAWYRALEIHPLVLGVGEPTLGDRVRAGSGGRGDVHVQSHQAQHPAKAVLTTVRHVPS